MILSQLAEHGIYTCWPLVITVILVWRPNLL